MSLLDCYRGGTHVSFGLLQGWHPCLFLFIFFLAIHFILLFYFLYFPQKMRSRLQYNNKEKTNDNAYNQKISNIDQTLKKRKKRYKNTC